MDYKKRIPKIAEQSLGFFFAMVAALQFVLQ